MRVILIGGGETIETIYFLARLFVDRAYQVAIINPHPAEARMLSRQVKATVILGDGSEPAVLEEAGARRADVVLALAAYDPDNLVACQIAKSLYGVPRTMALVNDPDNEDAFRQLGLDMVVSATRIIGRLIEGHTVYDEVMQLFPAAQGRVNVTEIELPENTPAAGKCLQDLELPTDSLVACIIREGEVIVPRGASQLQAHDHLILIALPENQEELLLALTGEEAGSGHRGKRRD
jgi:trk system potassium uptake protein TrkA